MAIKDFDAARRERRRERALAPIGFKLGGETFLCLPVVPVGAALDLEEAPEIREDEAAAAKSLAKFIDSVLTDDDRPRFDALLHRRDDPIDGTDLFEVAVHLAGEYAARPTSPSIDFFGGRATTGPTSSSSPSPTDSESSET